MGYEDVGIYNEDSEIPTPHLDGLAGEGIRFMDAHAPGALCHPSRYGLLTGRYPFRTDTSIWPNEPVIEEGRMTIASLLRSQGYWMAMVDAEIGKILSAIEQANMSEETLVIFTSDNGQVWYEKDIERFGHDSVGGLRGMKGDAYEGGHRMPFIVRWPGVVEEGSMTQQTISFTDMLATFADMTGTELPVDAGEDSFSILPVLTGSQPETEAIRPPVVVTVGRGMRSIQD